MNLNKHRTHDDTAGRRRLSLWYRMGWRFNYAMLNTYGPAELGGAGQPDPRAEMRKARELRSRAVQPDPPVIGTGT